MFSCVRVWADFCFIIIAKQVNVNYVMLDYKRMRTHARPRNIYDVIDVFCSYFCKKSGERAVLYKGKN
jgi:hypothetical protein